ncbi:uncharacterized protein EURHEDRAFT_407609 [Aspergillus ruber CBS 135680]|uniref:Uncharacterized protein n=1 Tax=Aspergillus ruber (strain CBS 135680) TaxID=1388766 RepID=A0A017SS60_ASPRC|nr:uncharacterized protein EURHEDRAFT_407609 [Aspergillus ruber CBS 135680]EYE99621.1 hypothetical protein EURHEDRAFT_407609 [Aspergillus ruber CBS 135680]
MEAPEPSEFPDSVTVAVPEKTYYHYHIPFGTDSWMAMYIFFGLTATIAWFQYDYNSKAFWFLFQSCQFLKILFDPDVCSLSKKKKLPNGSEVKVNKPLIGFRTCEKQMTEFPGASGGALPNKWKYERAYLRI